MFMYRYRNISVSLQNPEKYTIFSDYNMYFPPQIWEENGGASYSPNVASLACYRISALKDVIKYFTTFFASKFFFLFSFSKT